MINQRRLVLIDADQIGLDERHMSPCLDQQPCQILGLQAAAFGQGLPSFGSQALDAGFDRNAPRSAQQTQHVGLPQVDPGLHAKRTSR